MSKETKLNKLFKESELKLDANKTNRRVILVEFVQEYNKIWSGEQSDFC
jgi:hypothetical protein